MIGQPSGLLRFVLRDGKRILQQQWEIQTTEPIPGDDSGALIIKSYSAEWHDVPLVEEA